MVRPAAVTLAFLKSETSTGTGSSRTLARPMAFISAARYLAAALSDGEPANLKPSVEVPKSLRVVRWSAHSPAP